MQKLVEGVHQFQAEAFRQHEGLFRELAHGQAPHTLFITCSDSRVVPNLITNAGPGELFTVRNIGNVVPQPSLPGGTAAAIEYAVVVLGVENVVVCGHTQCGAMKALLDPASVANLPFVKRWIDQTERVNAIVRERYGHLSPEEQLTAAVEENVLVQIEHLREFEFIAERLEKRTLRVAGWVFDIEKARIFEYDPTQGQFRSIV